MFFLTERQGISSITWTVRVLYLTSSISTRCDIFNIFESPTKDKQLSFSSPPALKNTLKRAFLNTGGSDVRKFEPRTQLGFGVIDKSIKELRAIYKVHPEWFETPHPESNRGKNEVNYSIN